MNEREPMEEEDEVVWCSISGANVATHGTPLQQLEAFRDQWANRRVDPSKGAILELSRVVITRRIIDLLLPFMYPFDDEDFPSLQEDNDDNDDTMDEDSSLGAARHDTTLIKFSSVRLEKSCRFFFEFDVTTEEDYSDICRIDDKRCFLSALALVPESLSIEEQCDEIVSGLLSIPDLDRLEAKTLVICQERPLRSEEYLRLGDMIRGSVQLTDLTLHLTMVDAPQPFLDNLAESTHIQALNLGCPSWRRSHDQAREQWQSWLVAGEHGDGLVQRMLRNPQNQLIELELCFTDLEDDHLLAIAQLLPDSRVEVIDFSLCRVQPNGLLEFFRQLPKMPSLDTICFKNNPWENAPREVIEECGQVLLEGIMEHPSMLCVDPLERFPQCPLLWHHLCLNQAGHHRILTAARREDDDPLPLGLWPHILARAGSIGKGRPSIIHTLEEDKEDYVFNGAANAVFFFLRSRPEICYQS